MATITGDSVSLTSYSITINPPVEEKNLTKHISETHNLSILPSVPNVLFLGHADVLFHCVCVCVRILSTLIALFLNLVSCLAAYELHK